MNESQLLRAARFELQKVVFHDPAPEHNVFMLVHWSNRGVKDFVEHVHVPVEFQPFFLAEEVRAVEVQPLTLGGGASRALPARPQFLARAVELSDGRCLTQVPVELAEARSRYLGLAAVAAAIALPAALEGLLWLLVALVPAAFLLHKALSIPGSPADSGSPKAED